MHWPWRGQLFCLACWDDLSGWSWFYVAIVACRICITVAPLPSPSAQGKKGGRSKAAGKAAGGKQPGGAGGKGKAAATPVAVPNGSVGLTPGSALLAPKSTGGRSAATGMGGASTAARPPRPAKTPCSAATGGSLARLLAQGTPAGAAGGPAERVATVELPACCRGRCMACHHPHVQTASPLWLYRCAPYHLLRFPSHAVTSIPADSEAPGSALREEPAPLLDLVLVNFLHTPDCSPRIP